MGFRLNKQGNDKLYIRLPGRRTSLLGVHVLAPQVICQHDYRLPLLVNRSSLNVNRQYPPHRAQKRGNYFSDTLLLLYKVIITFATNQIHSDMQRIIKRQLTRFTTDDGRDFVRRITTVLRPNGTYRYPIDYYDATPGAVKISQRERDHLAVPGYKQFI